MADVEDEADFGSHFLHSMLEVEMTEEDNELDVSKNCDPLETLPPVPTFDLQSETFCYKDVYKNPAPQPLLTTIPLPPPSKVPLVINPSSVLIYPPDAPPPNPTTVLAPVHKISPKSNAKNLSKNISLTNAPHEDHTNEKFMEQVFRPEFVSGVFVEADTHSDIALVSEEEMKFYKTCFKDVSNVQKCRLHCTICDKHIGCAASVEKKINVHNMLKVLTCKPCFEFYGDGNFPCDTGDNCEIYCRWCGQGGALVCCSFCPRVFCKKCVKRNYGLNFLKSIEKASDWACFCCAQKPLWPHRAICRALLEYLAQKKVDPKTSLKDTSSCCKAAGLVRKRIRAALDKNKLTPPHNKLTLYPKTPNKPPDTKNKPPPPPKLPKTHFLLNPASKTPSPAPSPSPSPRNPKPTTSIFSPRSILTGNTIIRGITTTNPPKFISTFTPSQLPQTPVIHGETLITPPSRLLLHPKPPPAPTPSPSPSPAPAPAPPYNSSYVRVSLTHQTPNVDITKIPTVKIPHEVQGLVLRLIFPDNRMQYVRLTSDGSGCRGGREFPMPKLPGRGASFVEENLAEAFEMSRSLYEKLSRIREKVNSRTRLTEESVLNSSVKKLRVAYAKAVDVLGELERTLGEQHGEWERAGRGRSVDVIEVSDDEGVAVKRAKGERYSSVREKCRTLNEDSDIEIIEDVAVNGRGPRRSPKKRPGRKKYRLRRAPEQGKAGAGDGGAPVKRKKGRPRKYNKEVSLENGKGGGGGGGGGEEAVGGVSEAAYDERTKSGEEDAGEEGEKGEKGVVGEGSGVAT